MKKEYLGKNITAFISKEHGFGTDAVLLADFANPRASDKICDLGTGCGIIPLLWCRNERKSMIYAIDIQKSACEQLSEAIKINSIEDKIEVINADLRELGGRLPKGTFDIVTMNPPYKAPNAGIKNNSDAASIARHELSCTMADVAAAASSLLRFGGKLFICQRPERLCDVFDEMRKAGIEPKRLRLVVQRSGEAPWLVLVEGRRGSKPGLTVCPDLLITENGEYSAEMKEICKDYYGNKANKS